MLSIRSILKQLYNTIRKNLKKVFGNSYLIALIIVATLFIVFVSSDFDAVMRGNRATSERSIYVSNHSEDKSEDIAKAQPGFGLIKKANIIDNPLIPLTGRWRFLTLNDIMSRDGTNTLTASIEANDINKKLKAQEKNETDTSIPAVVMNDAVKANAFEKTDYSQIETTSNQKTADQSKIKETEQNTQRVNNYSKTKENVSKTASEQGKQKTQKSVQQTTEKSTQKAESEKTEKSKKKANEQKTEKAKASEKTEKPTQKPTEQKTEEPTEASKQDEPAVEYVSNAIGLQVSQIDYDNLLRIVESEAGNQDAIGRMLIVNVILNRLYSSQFPNNITSIIYQNNGIIYQFAPVRNGLIYRVTPSQLTIECVNRVLAGEDHSQGAKFFSRQSPPTSWFNTSLNFLFAHGAHYFYR